VKLYGLLLSVPSNVAPLKNSTFVTVPSLSLALAVIAMLAGALNRAPSAGLEILTVGGTLAVELTAMLIGLEVAASPALSVARAVSV
jgi:hypothetical protein